jgi:hypothetical protein
MNENDYTLADNVMGSIQDDSVVNKYLTKIQNRIRGGKTPEEYTRGTFWVFRRNPCFILDSGIEPNPLYEPRVFLWFPHFFKKDLKCPQCNTGLKIKGFNNKPKVAKARRIIDLTE